MASIVLSGGFRRFGSISNTSGNSSRDPCQCNGASSSGRIERGAPHVAVNLMLLNQDRGRGTSRACDSSGTAQNVRNTLPEKRDRRAIKDTIQLFISLSGWGSEHFPSARLRARWCRSPERVSDPCDSLHPGTERPCTFLGRPCESSRSVKTSWGPDGGDRAPSREVSSPDHIRKPRCLGPDPLGPEPSPDFSAQDIQI